MYINTILYKFTFSSIAIEAFNLKKTSEHLNLIYRVFTFILIGRRSARVGDLVQRCIRQCIDHCRDIILFYTRFLRLLSASPTAGYAGLVGSCFVPNAIYVPVLRIATVQVLRLSIKAASAIYLRLWSPRVRFRLPGG